MNIQKIEDQPIYPNGNAETLHPIFDTASQEAREILQNGHDIVLLTGDTGSVGQLVAQRFLDEGRQVVGMNSGKSNACVEGLLDYSAQAGGRYGCLTVDFADPENIKALMDSGMIDGRKITDLIMTAGRLYDGKFGDFQSDQLTKAFNEHALTPYILMQEMAKVWKEANGPKSNPNPENTHRSMVYVSSVASIGASPGEGPYVGAKAAAEGFVRTVARDTVDRNITVNAVRPGLIIDSAMGKYTAANRPDVIARIPGTPVTSAEVADVVHMFSRLPGMTGQFIDLNGGRTLGH